MRSQIYNAATAARDAGYFGPSWTPWLEIGAVVLLVAVALWAVYQRRR